MNYEKEKVSIITPSYNAISTIEETYNSLVSQSYSNWEWIVTDDCSTDGTVEFLESLSNRDKRVRIYKNTRNSGAALSRNNSLKHATGEFLAFIDSDDIWFSDKLEKQIDFMSLYIGVDFSFTAYELIDAKGKKMNKKIDLQGEGFYVNYIDMLKKKATLGCSTVMLRRAAFNDISMPLIRTGQDYALWLKLLKNGSKAYLLNEVLTKYRILPNSISRNKFKKSMRQWQIYRKVERLSIFFSTICFLSYAWRAVFRK
jgi:glycosyltransferase involved in cell wall biosynthesis